VITPTRAPLVGDNTNKGANPRVKTQGYNKPLTINVPDNKCQNRL
jgi:hypothetical protein